MSRRSQTIAARCAIGSCCSPARQGRPTSSRSTSRCSDGSMMRSLQHTRVCRTAPTPTEAPEILERMFAPLAHGERIGRFLAAEGVRAVIAPSGNRPSGGISGGTLIVDGDAGFGFRAYEKAHQMQVPTVIVANEHYGRLERLLTRNVPVRVEVNVDAVFTGDREEGFNVLAEIPASILCAKIKS